jgi:hypothetical protein
MDLNPYDADAGTELDALIHHFVTGKLTPPEGCPRYSSDSVQARGVLAQLKSSYGISVVYGRTGLDNRVWFARVNSTRGAEVHAATLPLAICRLALLRGRELATKGRGSRTRVLGVY